MIPLQLGFCKLKSSTTNNLLVLEFNINPFFITTSRVDLISHNRELDHPGALLSGGLRSFGLLHCGIRSRRHCGARMAAPGTAIVENERDGQHWGRHLPHGVTVAQCSVRISSRVTSEK